MDRTRIYLIGYILFMSGVFGALWELEILAKIGTGWTVIGVMIVVGIGLVTSVLTSHRRAGVEAQGPHGPGGGIDD